MKDEITRGREYSQDKEKSEKIFRHAMACVGERAQNLVDRGDCPDIPSAMRKIKAENPLLFEAYMGDCSPDCAAGRFVLREYMAGAAGS